MNDNSSIIDTTTLELDHSHVNPEWFAALSEAQGKTGNAKKDSVNPHFRSKYADLAEVLDTIKLVFPSCGLSISQWNSFDGSRSHVYTMLGHKSGGYVIGKSSCIPAKTDAQGVGATWTYLRRYSAAAIAGIAQEDDDGNSAAHNGKPSQSALVSEKQAASITDYLESTGSDVPKFLAWLKADSVESIRAHDYDRAIAALKKKSGNGTAD